MITFLDCLEPSTRHVFETDAGEQFAFTTADCAGRVDISDFGARLDAANNALAITAIGCVNLEISGSGTLDGSGAEGDWWSWPKESRNSARRARTLFLHQCESVRVSGITVQMGLDTPKFGKTRNMFSFLDRKPTGKPAN